MFISTMSDAVILYVEDSEDDRDLAERVFRRSGFSHELVFMRNGVEALEYLFAGKTSNPDRPPIPRVMLLDLNLPKLGGLEVLKCVRADARTHRLPVVILSSSDMQVDIARCYALGANSYVRKPADFAEFASTLEHVGVYWLLVNQAPREGPEHES